MSPELYDVGHFLVVGKSRYGKTTAVKQMAASFRRKGRGVIALTSMPHEWDGLAHWATDDQEAFVRVALQDLTSCLVVVDECSEMSGTFNKVTSRLATRGRHRGHVCVFIGQCATQVNPDIRRNCSSLLLFKSSLDDCQTLNKTFVDPCIFDAPSLEKGECIAIIEDRPGIRRKVY